MLTKRGYGLSRRDFIRLAGNRRGSRVSGALTRAGAGALEKAAAGRPKVVWLHFASDTGVHRIVHSKSDHRALGSWSSTS